MKDRVAAIIKAQEAINGLRRGHNHKEKYNSETGQYEVIDLKSGDKGFIPPAEKFVTVEWGSGFMTIDEKEFRKMTVAKRSKILSIPFQRGS